MLLIKNPEVKQNWISYNDSASSVIDLRLSVGCEVSHDRLRRSANGMYLVFLSFGQTARYVDHQYTSNQTVPNRESSEGTHGLQKWYTRILFVSVRR